MSEAIKKIYTDLGIASPGPRVVLRADNTIEPGEDMQPTDARFADGVDSLFGQRPAYTLIQKEKPIHRMILWMTLNSSKVKEIAVALRVGEQLIRNVQHQPWFQDAFCKLAAEMGRDAVQTYLKAEAMPAIMRTVELAKNADSDAVKLAANREILDRLLGKPVVKAEMKSESTVDVTVATAADLLAERERLNEQLKANGLLSGAN